MFKYLKEYKIRDMQTLIENSKKPPKETLERLDGKLCVITGGTSGVGLAVVKRLYQFGAKVLMINRNEEKSERIIREITNEIPATNSASLSYWICDFSDLTQTAQTAKRLSSHEQDIQVLINNAGIHKTKRHYTKEGFEIVFAVNHLSSFILTKTVLEKMKKQNSGRIIQVNSQGHRFSGLKLSDLDWKKRIFTGLQSYGAAKTAQLLCTWEFCKEIGSTPITINAMHPGQVKSAVGMDNGPIYRWFQNKFVIPSLDEVKISGIALHYLAVAPELDEISGKYFNLTTEEKPAPHALDPELGQEIWKKSCEIAAQYLDS
jgi:retinol dehydrogenase-13